MFVLDLDREMPGDRVGELRRLLDLINRDQRLLRHRFVQLDVFAELRGDGARQRLERSRVAERVVDHFGLRFEIAFVLGVRNDLRATHPLDQNFNRLIRQFQQLQNGGDDAHLMNVARFRMIVRCVSLGREQDLTVLLHHHFERADRLLAAHEQRHDHVGKHHNVAQRKHRECFGWRGGLREIAHKPFPSASFRRQRRCVLIEAPRRRHRSPPRSSGTHKVEPVGRGFKLRSHGADRRDRNDRLRSSIAHLTAPRLKSRQD